MSTGPPTDRRFTDVEVEILAAARLLAVGWMPYLASALFEVTMVRAPTSDTFAVDARWRLYVGPAALGRWTVEEIAGVLLHEVGHLLRDHHGRHAEQERQDAWRWNLAGDAEINDDLLAAGIPLPGSPITPGWLDQPDGQLAERYFASLLAAADELDDPGCGSGAGGAHRPEELGEDDPSLPGTTEHDADLVRRQVAGEIDRHDDGAGAGDGRDAGPVPGGWRRWAAAQLAPPVVDWRQLLQRRVRRGLAVSAGQQDTTYRRPGRRRVAGVVTPASVRPHLSVGVVIDTSSSMTEELLDAALAELDGICRRAGVAPENRLVVTADAAVQSSVRLRGARDLDLTGGGGTDLRPAIEHLVAHRRRPRTIVVLTDGHTPWPCAPPRGRHLIVVLLRAPDVGAPPSPPPWAEVVTIDADH